MGYNIIGGTEPTCLQCGKVLHGRTDKKFCSDICRSRYRYARASARKYTMDAIEQNYSILSDLICNGIRSIPLAKALKIGFSKEVVTGYRRRDHGHIEARCFDISYTITELRISRISRPVDKETL